MTIRPEPLTLHNHPKLPMVVEFDGPETSTDGGVLLLRQIDDQQNLTAPLAACLPDNRDPARVRHSRHEQLRQRVFQMALGYEDCNDADTLRQDPLLNTACDRTPNDRGLSSQATLSRFENATDGRSLNKILRSLENSYIAALDPDTEVLLLDLDSTDDETHGAQQLTFFNAHYNHHMYHPLLIYDGDSGELITALLRPGNNHASRGAKGVLRRLIRKIRRRCPYAAIVVRGDSAFAVPRILKELERLNEHLGNVDYLIGLAKNRALERLAAPTMELAKELYEKQQQEVMRFSSFSYAAGSWPHRRRVIVKAQHSAFGKNPRFLVTSIDGFPPEDMYRAYCGRGQCENWIKDFKNALIADRLSCCSFRANFFRLLMHAIAYRLMYALRQTVAPFSKKLGKAQFDTLRLRLLKVAAQVTQSVRRILVRLTQSFPDAEIFRNVAAELASGTT